MIFEMLTKQRFDNHIVIIQPQNLCLKLFETICLCLVYKINLSLVKQLAWDGCNSSKYIVRSILRCECFINHIFLSTLTLASIITICYVKKSKMNYFKPPNNHRIICLHTLWSMQGYTPLKPTIQVVIIIKLDSIVKRRIMNSFQV